MAAGGGGGSTGGGGGSAGGGSGGGAGGGGSAGGPGGGGDNDRGWGDRDDVTRSQTNSVDVPAGFVISDDICTGGKYAKC